MLLYYSICMVDREGNTRKIEKILNQLLMPLAVSYGYVKKIARKTKEKIPFVYGEVESLIKSQLVNLEKDRELLHEPDIEKLSGVITANIINMLPNLDEKQLNDIIAANSSRSFLDMLTRGLSTTAEKDKD